MGGWKVVSVLTQYLPNLWIDVVCARRTGILGVSNLDPNNPELNRNFESIVLEFVGTDLAELGPDHYYGDVSLVSPEKYLSGLSVRR